MFHLRAIEATTLASVVVVFACRGLLRRYPAFGLFLAGKGTRTLCLLSIDYHDQLYGKLWAFSAPFIMTLQFLVILELTDKIVRHYPKIDKRGAQLIIASCLAVGTCFGAVSSLIQFGGGDCPWYIPTAVGACKLLDWLSVGTLLFVSVWLYLYPENMPRNLQWHRWLLAIYMGVAPGIALVFSTVAERQRSMVDAANWALEVVEICCCLLWVATMTETGERAREVPRTLSEVELARIDHDYQAVFGTLREEFPLPELMPELKRRLSE